MSCNAAAHNVYRPPICSFYTNDINPSVKLPQKEDTCFLPSFLIFLQNPNDDFEFCRFETNLF